MNNCTRGEGYGPRPTAAAGMEKGEAYSEKAIQCQSCKIYFAVPEYAISPPEHDCQEYTNHTAAGCPTCGVDGGSKSTAAREVIQQKRINRKLSLENVILRQALKTCNECAHEFRSGDTATAILAKRIADVSEEALRHGGGEGE